MLCSDFREILEIELHTSRPLADKQSKTGGHVENQKNSLGSYLNFVFSEGPTVFFFEGVTILDTVREVRNPM